MRTLESSLQDALNLRRNANGGFTLIELLVTITIIAIVMTFSLGAIFMAQESAREQKTRALVTKIDQIVMERYESFRTRRVPIQMGVDRNGNAFSETPPQFAKRRLEALRELMRMELPDRWTDITDDTVVLPTTSSSPKPRPALSAAYKRAYNAISPKPTLQYQGAECLYLILSLCGDERAAIITERNSGDKDGDGAREILDGWGRPISFLRWPAGFLNSATNGHVTDLQSGDATTDHDPFDYRKKHTEAYATYPLVYSGGPDGVTDIMSDADDPDGSAHSDEEATSPSTPAHYNTLYPASGNQFYNSPIMQVSSKLIGQPSNCGIPADGLQQLDNIHNHMLGIR